MVGSCVRTSLCNLHTPNASDMRAGIDVGLEIGGLELALVWAGTSLLSGYHHSVKGEVWSQAARAETLRDEFPLSMYFLLSLYWFLASESEGTETSGAHVDAELGLATDKVLVHYLYRWPWLCSDAALDPSSSCPLQLPSASTVATLL